MASLQRRDRSASSPTSRSRIGSHHGLITDFNIRIDAQIVHPGRHPCSRAGGFLGFIFETQFLFP